MNTIDISIVVPTYNSSNKIINLINSCSKIEELTYEVILVDDFSSDIESLYRIISNNPEFKVIKNKYKANASINRNYGISISKGKYIFLMDSDDYFTEEYLRHRIMLMDSNSGVYYGNFLKKDSFGYHPSNIRAIECNENPVDYLFHNNQSDFRTSTISFTADFKDSVIFDERLFKHQDWGLLCNLSESGVNINFDNNNFVIINECSEGRMSFKSDIYASFYFYYRYCDRSTINAKKEFIKKIIRSTIIENNYKKFNLALSIFPLSRFNRYVFILNALNKIGIINKTNFSKISKYLNKKYE
ncbi:glycosyltransferase family 2 protein [Photobacterium leiognathi]|uniref:glycosyltransferase family 2 protein n=1 Tax=Photobacterium leiognathi TaxID=553611 RepID=UPI0029810EE6|nr:glycosyltransferase family 2 protein [Photobacterium leiognathi]